jgi:hypothetical protein
MPRVPELQAMPREKNSMSKDRSGIDLKKMSLIQNCLTKLFHDLHIGGEFLNVFAFTNGTQSGQLKFHREFLDAFQSSGKLQEYMDATVIPAVQTNPDKQIEVDTQGALTITERQP